MVKDKINFRADGKYAKLTKQPVAGRANDGGLRIGEMERDAVIGHGIAGFLQESISKRSDGYFEGKTYKVQLNQKTGLMSYDKNDEKDICNIEIPYATKLFLQELETMSIAPRLITEETIHNKPVFNYLLNNLSENNIEYDYDDDTEEEEEDQ